MLLREPPQWTQTLFGRPLAQRGIFFLHCSGCILYPDDSLFNAQKADRTKGYNVTCDGDDIIEELHQKYANNAVRKDKDSRL